MKKTIFVVALILIACTCSADTFPKYNVNSDEEVPLLSWYTDKSLGNVDCMNIENYPNDVCMVIPTEEDGCVMSCGTCVEWEGVICLENVNCHTITFFDKPINQVQLSEWGSAVLRFENCDNVVCRAFN